MHIAVLEIPTSKRFNIYKANLLSVRVSSTVALEIVENDSTTSLEGNFGLEGHHLKASQ